LGWDLILYDKIISYNVHIILIVRFYFKQYFSLDGNILYDMYNILCTWYISSN